MNPDEFVNRMLYPTATVYDLSYTSDRERFVQGLYGAGLSQLYEVSETCYYDKKQMVLPQGTRFRLCWDANGELDITITKYIDDTRGRGNGATSC